MSLAKLITKRASLLHHKILYGALAVIALGGIGYGANMYHIYYDTNLSQNLTGQAFESPSLDSLTSDIFNDNAGSENASDESDITADPSGSKAIMTHDTSHSVRFKNGKIGYDNASVHTLHSDIGDFSDMNDESDNPKYYTFTKNNKMDPSDHLTEKHVDNTSSYSKASDKYASDSDFNYAKPDDKTMTYHINNRRRTMTIGIQEPNGDKSTDSDGPYNPISKIRYHWSFVSGLFNHKYTLKPIALKRFGDSHFHHIPYHIAKHYVIHLKHNAYLHRPVHHKSHNRDSLSNVN